MDRNLNSIKRFLMSVVALRKESVDRNKRDDLQGNRHNTVALRKESVDRNLNAVQIIVVVMRRSPQGERG